MASITDQSHYDLRKHKGMNFVDNVNNNNKSTKHTDNVPEEETTEHDSLSDSKNTIDTESEHKKEENAGSSLQAHGLPQEQDNEPFPGSITHTEGGSTVYTTAPVYGPPPPPADEEDELKYDESGEPIFSSPSELHRFLER
ncbi:8046_t:CDS:2, partial [Paraglomus occultum]